MDYKILIDIKNKYNATSQETIKSNLKYLMKHHDTKYNTIIELLDISHHTAYSYTNKANSNKPDLYNLMILAYYFNIDVTELFKPM